MSSLPFIFRYTYVMSIFTIFLNGSMLPKANHLLLVASPSVSSAIYCTSLFQLLMHSQQPCISPPNLRIWTPIFFSFKYMMAFNSFPSSSNVLKEFSTVTIFISPPMHDVNYYSPHFNIHFFTDETTLNNSWK